MYGHGINLLGFFIICQALGLQDSDDEAEAADQAADQVKFVPRIQRILSILFRNRADRSQLLLLFVFLSLSFLFVLD